ncbi:MAG: formyltransferase [Synergistaceae bacterium]|nr:formyltransferase [Synergistaceae bacterium]
MRPRIVVFAYNEVGYVCLDELLRRGADVAAVFTYDDDPDEEVWFRSVRDRAREGGVACFTPQRIDGEWTERIAALRPELILSFYYRSLLGPEILALPRLGAFNIHGSLLPRYRGRACVNWAVLNGEGKTGATLHEMVPRADAGRIVDQEAVLIGPDETAHDVFLKVAGASRTLVARNLDALEAGMASLIEQDETKATLFGRRGPEDGKIDWNLPARSIHDLVRAVTHPYPGAFTFVSGRKLFLWKTAVVDERSPNAGGTVASRSPFVVNAAQGRLAVLSAQFEGEDEAPGEAIARALPPQARLGTPST